VKDALKNYYLLEGQCLFHADILLELPKSKDVLPDYVKGCRKKFRLTVEYGVSDEEFFSV